MAETFACTVCRNLNTLPHHPSVTETVSPLPTTTSSTEVEESRRLEFDHTVSDRYLTVLKKRET